MSRITSWSDVHCMASESGGEENGRTIDHLKYPSVTVQMGGQIVETAMFEVGHLEDAEPSKGWCSDRTRTQES